MIDRLIKRFPLPAWLALCLCVTLIVLFLGGLPAESEAWNAGIAIHEPFWSIAGGIALAWLGDGIFWAAMLFTVVVGRTLWLQARNSQQ